MRKTRLKVEDLAVESFATEQDASQAKGTVHAHASIPDGPCNSYDPCTYRITCDCTPGTRCSCTDCFNSICEDLC